RRALQARGDRAAPGGARRRPTRPPEEALHAARLSALGAAVPPRLSGLQPPGASDAGRAGISHVRTSAASVRRPSAPSAVAVLESPSPRGSTRTVARSGGET